MFWTLFDQKGSRWTIQATNLDGHFGALIVQPDQMQTFNPILILTLVPIMDSVVYPLIKKCGFNFTPLKRMTVGMFLAAMAFVCAALVQLEVDKTLPTFPSAAQSQLRLLNMGTNTSVTLPGNEPLPLLTHQASADYYTFDTDTVSVSIGNPPVIKDVILTKGHRQTLLIPTNLTYEWRLTDDLISKPQRGNNAIRFVNGMGVAINISTAEADFGLIEPLQSSNYSLIKNGKRTFTIKTESQSCEYNNEFGFGSSYTFFIPSSFTFGANCGESITAAEDIQPNSVHMALQIPQYFFITAGEVMFSVTGLEFSYSQAPSNMKAVLQAGWLFTVAIGNFIVLIVAEIAKLPKQWTEYLLFACLLVAVCFIFSIMAYFYTYIDPAEIEAQFRNKTIVGDDDDDDDRKYPQKTEVEMKKKMDMDNKPVQTKL